MNTPAQIQTITPGSVPPIPEGCTRLFGVHQDAKSLFSEIYATSATHYIDVRLPDPVDPARESFEAWAATRELDLYRAGDGYFYSQTQIAWYAWKAAKSS